MFGCIQAGSFAQHLACPELLLAVGSVCDTALPRFGLLRLVTRIGGTKPLRRTLLTPPATPAIQTRLRSPHPQQRRSNANLVRTFASCWIHAACSAPVRVGHGSRPYRPPCLRRRRTLGPPRTLAWLDRRPLAFMLALRRHAMDLPLAIVVQARPEALIPRHIFSVEASRNLRACLRRGPPHLVVCDVAGGVIEL